MTTELIESFGLDPAHVQLATSRAVRRHGAPASATLSAAKLLGEAWAGNRYAALAVNEALSTSDLFKSAAGDIFDRSTIAQYAAMPKQWTKFATPTSVRDFRPKFLRDLAGGRRRFERVPELTEYPSADYTVTERTISVSKTGRMFGYSFEAAINDQLEELKQVPGEFANSAVLTEDYMALTQLANPLTGAPATSFFTAGRGNLGTGALTQPNLQAAITSVSTKRDVDGSLLSPGPLQLVVGPALQFTAQRLLDQTLVRVVNGPVTTEEPNPLRGRVTLTVLENLPGAAWFVLPLASAPRPAFYTATLLGHEAVDVRYKNDQGSRPGGGSIAPEEGNFEVDGVYWRARHIFGAAAGDPVFTYASDGLGT